MTSRTSARARMGVVLLVGALLAACTNIVGLDKGYVFVATDGGISDADAHAASDVGVEAASVDATSEAAPACKLSKVWPLTLACQGCMATHCCEDANTCAGKQSCVEYSQCYYGCAADAGSVSVSACRTGCNLRTPGGKNDLNSLLACLNNSCPLYCPN